MDGLAGYASDDEDSEANVKRSSIEASEESGQSEAVTTAKLETEWEMFQQILDSEEGSCVANEQASVLKPAEDTPGIGKETDEASSDPRLPAEQDHISCATAEVGSEVPTVSQVFEGAEADAEDDEPSLPDSARRSHPRSSSPMSMDMSHDSDTSECGNQQSVDDAGKKEHDMQRDGASSSAGDVTIGSNVATVTKPSSSTGRRTSEDRERQKSQSSTSVKSRQQRDSRSSSRSRSASTTRSTAAPSATRSIISRLVASAQGGRHRTPSKERRSQSRDTHRVTARKEPSRRSRSRSTDKSRRTRRKGSSRSPSRRSRSGSRRSRSRTRRSHSRTRRSRSRTRRSRSRHSRSKSRRSLSKSRRSRSRSRRSRSGSRRSGSKPVRSRLRRSRSRSDRKAHTDAYRRVDRRGRNAVRSSRGNRDKLASRRRSRSRRSSRSGRRSRSRSASRNRQYNRSRSRGRSRSPDDSRRRNRSRSRGTSRRRSSSVSKGNSPSGSSGKLKAPVQEPHVDFKTKMKMELQKAAKDALEGKCIIDQKNLVTYEKPSLSAILMAGTSEKVTAQQAMMQTLAAMHAKAQELTGVAIPKYYNPAAVNPLKYAEQMQKRKLLWSKTKDTKEATAQWQGTSVVVDEKFRKLMGIKEGEVEIGELSEEQLQKQAELFAKLDQEYAFARMATHTHRGMGLGAVSNAAANAVYTPPAGGDPLPPQPSQPKGGT